MKKTDLFAAAAVICAMTILSGCGDAAAEPANATVSESADEAVTEAADGGADTDEPSAEGTEAAVEDIDITTVLNSVMEQTAMTSMTEVGSDRIGNYIEADMDKISSFSMWICGSGAFADETAIFVLSDESYAADLEDLLNARIEKRNDEYKDYKPEECDKMGDAVVKTEGKYVFYAISSDNSKAESIFDENF